MISTEEDASRVLTVTLCTEKESDGIIQLRQEEAGSLLKVLSLVPVSHVTFNLHSANSTWLVGRGQLEEISQLARYFNADLVYFDTALTPGFQRNLESALQLPVLDRNELIIRIFARNARTREARLQVQLAMLEYMRPRIRQSANPYSQQRGGVRGAKGEGERQIELDRRRIDIRISRLKDEICAVRKNRDSQRKKRLSSSIVSFALAGYTNSGKSSLLKALTKADTLCEDRLFATLDPLERTMNLSPSLKVLICDTVGFVSNLPHFLIDAFSSTLEEAALADVLILVLDSSSPRLMTDYETTLSVLEELGATGKSVITVFNKCDLPCGDDFAIQTIKARHPDAISLSARSGENLETLKERIQQKTFEILGARSITLSVDDTNAIDSVYREYEVLKADYTEKEVIMHVKNKRSGN